MEIKHNASSGGSTSFRIPDLVIEGRYRGVHGTLRNATLFKLLPPFFGVLFHPKLQSYFTIQGDLGWEKIFRETEPFADLV